MPLDPAPAPTRLRTTCKTLPPGPRIFSPTAFWINLPTTDKHGMTTWISRPDNNAHSTASSRGLRGKPGRSRPRYPAFPRCSVSHPGVGLTARPSTEDGGRTS